MKINFLPLILFILISCSSSRNNLLTEKHCDELEKIMLKDQATRHKISELSLGNKHKVFKDSNDLKPFPKAKMALLHYKYVRCYNKNIDSLLKDYKTKVNKIPTTEYLTKVDSLFGIMSSNDKQNLKTIIRFIKKMVTQTKVDLTQLVEDYIM